MKFSKGMCSNFFIYSNDIFKNRDIGIKLCDFSCEMFAYINIFFSIYFFPRNMFCPCLSVVFSVRRSFFRKGERRRKKKVCKRIYATLAPRDR